MRSIISASSLLELEASAPVPRDGEEGPACAAAVAMALPVVVLGAVDENGVMLAIILVKKKCAWMARMAPCRLFATSRVSMYILKHPPRTFPLFPLPFLLPFVFTRLEPFFKKMAKSSQPLAYEWFGG